MSSLTLGGSEPIATVVDFVIFASLASSPFFWYSILNFPWEHPSSTLRFLTNMNTPVHLNSILDLLLKQNEALEIMLRSVGVSHRAIREKCAWKQSDNGPKKDQELERKLERRKEKGRKLFTISLMVISAAFVLHEPTNSLYLFEPVWIGLLSFNKERVWNTTTPPSPHSEHSFHLRATVRSKGTFRKSILTGSGD